MREAGLLLPTSPAAPVTSMECSCCGEVPKHGSVALQCHPEIVLCYACLDWLSSKRDKQVAAEGGVQIASVEPMFRVSDVNEAVDHYRRLGFETEYHDATYAFAVRNNVTIHLAHIDRPDQRTTATIFLHVDNVDRLTDEWRQAGVEVTGPEHQDYGLRESSHVDPDGNLIRVGSPIST
jgi:catechol 2,3-dioxygenase-like lactoylglutathione lyase family enzyme